MDILLKDEQIKKYIDDWFLRDMDAIRTGAERPDQLEIAGNIAKSQLKKVVERFESEFPKMIGLQAVDLPLTGLWRTLKKEAGIE